MESFLKQEHSLEEYKAVSNLLYKWQGWGGRWWLHVPCCLVGDKAVHIAGTGDIQTGGSGGAPDVLPRVSRHKERIVVIGSRLC